MILGIIRTRFKREGQNQYERGRTVSMDAFTGMRDPSPNKTDEDKSLF